MRRYEDGAARIAIMAVERVGRRYEGDARERDGDVRSRRQPFMMSRTGIGTWRRSAPAASGQRRSRSPDKSCVVLYSTGEEPPGACTLARAMA
jgi:hypothetical protein